MLGQVFLPIGFVDAQEMALEANFSYPTVVQGSNTEVVDSNNEVSISGSALLPSVTNIGTIEGVNDGEALSDQIEVHVVKSGETMSQIAEMFGVSANTILWANNMKKGDKLVVGETLVILPIDGIQHIVVKGDTFKKIAAKYKGDSVEIAGFNSMSIEDPLIVGQELIIPNADIDAPVAVKKTTSAGSKTASSKTSSLQNISGYFINPVPNYVRRSQGYHGKNSVDLAAPTGTRVVASASGKVIVARYGWNGAYGNLIIIQHSNGTQTLYAHLSKISVTSGQQVSRGETIGLLGSTGRSTGPHLHFEVHGAKNPGTTTPMSWATK